MSLSDKMTVEFVSDYNNTGNGFLASWITEELEPVNIVETAGRCGGIIEPSNRRLTGEITSMGYPKLDYGSFELARWTSRLILFDLQTQTPRIQTEGLASGK